MFEFYAESGLRPSPNLTLDRVRKAYREMAMRFHPDREGGDRNRFERLTEDYDLLLDPEKRMIYGHLLTLVQDLVLGGMEVAHDRLSMKNHIIMGLSRRTDELSKAHHLWSRTSQPGRQRTSRSALPDDRYVGRLLSMLYSRVPDDSAARLRCIDIEISMIQTLVSEINSVSWRRPPAEVHPFQRTRRI